MIIFGYINSVYFNHSSAGDKVWFDSEYQRDRALTAIRERAVSRGLNVGSALAGLYPISKFIDDDDVVWFEDLQKGWHEPSERWNA